MPRPRMTVSPIAPKNPESAAEKSTSNAVCPFGGVTPGTRIRLPCWLSGFNRHVVDRAHGHDARDPRHAMFDVVEQLPALGRVVAVGGNREPQHSGRRGAEAGIHRRARLQTSQEEERGDEQRERDGDLPDDERVAHREAAHRAAVGVLVLDRLDDRRARRLKRGQEPEQHAGDRPMRATAKASTRQSSETSSVMGSGSGRSACNTARSAAPDTSTPATPPARGEQQRLDEELSHEHAPLGADREANRDFLAAIARLREEEAREVRARDEQHEPDDDHQRRRRGDDDGVEQRIDGDLVLGDHVSEVPFGQFAGYFCAMSAVNRSATALACTIDAPGARRALRNAE